MDRDGFTLTEVMIIVVIVGILAGIAIPNFMAARQRVNKETCINNLRQIKLAKEQWALENDKISTDLPVSTDLDTYVSGGTAALYCPNDSTKSFEASYSINDVGTSPICCISSDHRL